ncbi:MAG: HD domain-containing protein [Sedimentisphaerales bacterium]|nr:HD domain-containing protein [Sedimentisphaerales bacterium]
MSQTSTDVSTKERIIELLRSTNRKGVDGLIAFLEEEGFFASPASTQFHGAYPGGLAEHSLRVFQLLDGYSNEIDLVTATLPGQKPIPIEYDNIVIAGLLHDICKVGAYIGTEAPYTWNKKQPRGHALLSLQRIRRFIKLKDLEAMMIRYHMGVYGLYEFYEEGSWEYGVNAEYPIRGDHSRDDKLSKEESQKARYGQSLRNAWYHNPIVKLMYFCDELATMWDARGRPPRGGVD